MGGSTHSPDLLKGEFEITIGGLILELGQLSLGRAFWPDEQKGPAEQAPILDREFSVMPH